MKKFFKGSAMLGPLPAVLVTTVNKAGEPNVFTASWVGTACTHPPMVTLSVRPERLSYQNITATGTFVINIPPASLAREVDYCGVKSGRELDKLKKFGWQLLPAQNTAAPVIAACPVAMECHVRQRIPLGSHDMFVAEVTGIHVDDTLIDKRGKIRLESAGLLCYLHGEYFALINRSLGFFGFSVQKKKATRR